MRGASSWRMLFASCPDPWQPVGLISTGAVNIKHSPTISQLLIISFWRKRQAQRSSFSITCLYQLTEKSSGIRQGEKHFDFEWDKWRKWQNWIQTLCRLREWPPPLHSPIAQKSPIINNGLLMKQRKCFTPDEVHRLSWHAGADWI